MDGSSDSPGAPREKPPRLEPPRKDDGTNLNMRKPPIRLRKNVPLAPLSTFRIGGRAAQFAQVRTPEELIAVVNWAKRARLPYRVFAGGSNIVFPDRTLDGLLVQISGGKLVFRGRRCVADAGVPLAEVIEKSIRRGLRGLETLSGIPGTVGGAVVGNAGAYGHSISEAVRQVEVWDGTKRRLLTRRQCRFDYRESIFKKKPLLLLRVTLQFRRGKRNELRKISRDIIRLRLKKYRPGLRCPGSFFKNVLVDEVPKSSLGRIDRAKIIEGKIPAGYLLEQVGAKGMRVGGILIAPFHGNLFINRGGAAARDVRGLAQILKRRVNRRFGIRLEEEIRYF
jgi:UDP-N-acetylmuramate dehydrogenase